MHKAHIEVDRKGTKATAAGFIYGAGGCASDEGKYVYLTQPFLYAIVNNETGLPVFMGAVNNLYPNTENDGMTYMERAKICYGHFLRIYEKLDPYMDEDNVAEELYRKTRKVCMKADLREMQEMEDVIDQYLEHYRNKR